MKLKPAWYQCVLLFHMPGPLLLVLDRVHVKLLNVESGEVDKGSATINLQVTFFEILLLAVMTMRMRCTVAYSTAID